MNSEYFNQYLTIEVLQAGTITWGCSVNNSTYFRSIQYRKKGSSSWITLQSKYSSTPAYISTGSNAGYIFEIRATSNQQYGNNQNEPEYYYNSFGGTAKVKIYGNILSLTGVDVTSLTNASTTKLTISHQFAGLFQNYTNLMDVKDLWLSVNTLTPFCYSVMFKGCTNIKQAPELLTEQLVQSCYDMMFYNCTSLNFIKCTAKYFGTFSCNSWVYNVNISGQFVKADNISNRTPSSDNTQNDSNGWVVNTNGIPRTWAINTLSEYESAGGDDSSNQKYKLAIDKSDSTTWPTLENDEKRIIKVNNSTQVMISNENDNGRKLFDFYKYNDSDYKDAFATDSPRSLIDSRKVSFEKAFVKEYNSVNNHTRQIGGFQTEYSKFFASNSFTNPTPSNNAFAYLRANLIKN